MQKKRLSAAPGSAPLKCVKQTVLPYLTILNVRGKIDL